MQFVGDKFAFPLRCFVMEKLSGSTLEDMLKMKNNSFFDEGEFGGETFTSLFHKFVDDYLAAVFAGAITVFHGDLHPGNIMVDPKHPSFQLGLIDWGNSITPPKDFKRFDVLGVVLLEYQEMKSKGKWNPFMTGNTESEKFSLLIKFNMMKHFDDEKYVYDFLDFLYRLYKNNHRQQVKYPLLFSQLYAFIETVTKTDEVNRLKRNQFLQAFLEIPTFMKERTSTIQSKEMWEMYVSNIGAFEWIREKLLTENDQENILADMINYFENTPLLKHLYQRLTLISHLTPLERLKNDLMRGFIITTEGKQDESSFAIEQFIKNVTVALSILLETDEKVASYKNTQNTHGEQTKGWKSVVQGIYKKLQQQKKRKAQHRRKDIQEIKQKHSGTLPFKRSTFPLLSNNQIYNDFRRMIKWSIVKDTA